MAIASTQVLEVRSATGSDTNGGGFNSAAAGTDWSQQTSPQYSVTDGVTAGTTTITSATANFGADVVGNLVYVSGGTGSVTAGWYEITARGSATSITVDRSTGLTTGTGVTLHIGGALATLEKAFAVHVAGNTIWATGAFTPSGAALTLAGNVAVIGYGSTRGDGMRCTVDATSMTAANNTFAISGSNSQMSNVAVANSKAISFTASGGNNAILNCKASVGAGAGFNNATQVHLCEASGNTGAGFANCTAVTWSFAHGQTGGSGDGFFRCAMTAFCVAAANSNVGFNNSASTTLNLNCIAYGNTGSGIVGIGAGAPTFLNCVAYGNGGFGYQWASINPYQHGVVHNCFAGSNTSGATTNGVAVIDGSITNLTAQPFIDPTTAFDFTPNTTAGGGALLRNAGFASVAGCLNPGFLDAGAIRHQDPASVSIPAPPITSRGFSLVG